MNFSSKNSPYIQTINRLDGYTFHTTTLSSDSVLYPSPHIHSYNQAVIKIKKKPYGSNTTNPLGPMIRVSPCARHQSNAAP